MKIPLRIPYIKKIIGIMLSNFIDIIIDILTVLTCFCVLLIIDGDTILIVPFLMLVCGMMFVTYKCAKMTIGRISNTLQKEE